MLDRAIESFSKHINRLTNVELEEKLNKYYSEKYTGLTLEEVCSTSIDCGSVSYHTKVQNFGWFLAKEPYFNNISDFFMNCLVFPDEGDLKPISALTKRRIYIGDDEILNPQNEIVGFLFMFVP